MTPETTKRVIEALESAEAFTQGGDEPSFAMREEIRNIIKILRAEQQRVEAPVTDGLLPCPFCGSAARIEKYYANEPENQIHRVSCRGLSCTVDLRVVDATKDLAIATWNTRANFDLTRRGK